MAIALFNDKDFINFLLDSKSKEYYFNNFLRDYFPSYKDYKIKYFYTDSLSIEIDFNKKSNKNSAEFDKLIENTKKKYLNLKIIQKK